MSRQKNEKKVLKICVIGAGPVGLWFALGLFAQGFSVVLLEKKKFFDTQKNSDTDKNSDKKNSDTYDDTSYIIAQEFLQDADERHYALHDKTLTFLQQIESQLLSRGFVHPFLKGSFDLHDVLLMRQGEKAHIFLQEEGKGFGSMISHNYLLGHGLGWIKTILEHFHNKNKDKVNNNTKNDSDTTNKKEFLFYQGISSYETTYDSLKKKWTLRFSSQDCHSCSWEAACSLEVDLLFMAGGFVHPYYKKNCHHQSFDQDFTQEEKFDLSSEFSKSFEQKELSSEYIQQSFEPFQQKKLSSNHSQQSFKHNKASFEQKGGFFLDYKEQALVITLKPYPWSLFVEYFHQEGVLALLPLGQEKVALVSMGKNVSLDHEYKKKLLKLVEEIVSSEIFLQRAKDIKKEEPLQEQREKQCIKREEDIIKNVKRNDDIGHININININDDIKNTETNNDMNNITLSNSLGSLENFGKSLRKNLKNEFLENRSMKNLPLENSKNNIFEDNTALKKDFQNKSLENLPLENLENNILEDNPLKENKGKIFSYLGKSLKKNIKNLANNRASSFPIPSAIHYENQEEKLSPSSGSFNDCFFSNFSKIAHNYYFSFCSQGQIFPLSFFLRKNLYYEGGLFLGSCSSTVHPMAGYGLNQHFSLLEDLLTLMNHEFFHPHDLSSLENYHQQEYSKLGLFTSSLMGVFGHNKFSKIQHNLWTLSCALGQESFFSSWLKKKGKG